MDIRTACVVGAGNMGSGIAQKIATEGVPVLLVDTTLAQAEQGKQRIQKLLHEGVARKIFTPPQVEQILGRITPAGEVAAARDADLVIEAVFEDLKVKRDLFTALGKVCRKDTLLATNTSSYLVADVATVVPHPERVLGLHYFFHPAKNRLVEVIGHAGTSPAVLRAAWAFQERIGKVPIVSADAPGFIVNRFFVPWLNEAVRLHEAGVAIATIEAAAKASFGVGMGPFELMNVTGVPITLHASQSLAERLGAFYAPAARLRQQVESKQPWDLQGQPDAAGFAKVSDTLWGVVLHVAAALVSEKVGTLEDTDLGARVGLRWPVGPFEQANAMGLGQARARARATEERYRLPTPTVLADAKLERFALSRVSLEVEGGVATIKIQRPDQLNALDPETVAQLEQRFIAAEGRADVRAIVIAGAGKAFVAGADLKFFVERMREQRYGEILSFARSGQTLFNRIERCPKPVICRLDGLALGGGAELALACHAIVATPRARLGFPETGIGIYPGLGGTQRLTARLGKGLARAYLYTGNLLSPDDLGATRLAWKVVPPAELDRAVVEAAKAAPKQERLATIPPNLTELAAFFAQAKVAELHAGSAQPPAVPAVQESVKRLRKKAALGLVAVEKLTALAEQVPLEAGLQAELDSMNAVFASADAYEGMIAVLERRAPSFKGS